MRNEKHVQYANAPSFALVTVLAIFTRASKTLQASNLQQELWGFREPTLATHLQESGTRRNKPNAAGRSWDPQIQKMQRALRDWAYSNRGPKRRMVLVISVCLGLALTWLISGGAATLGLQSPLQQIYWGVYSRVWVMQDRTQSEGRSAKGSHIFLLCSLSQFVMCTL